MARVYLGTDRTLGRPVAIKVLAQPYDRDRGYVLRFEREARAAARLSHPNIVQVFDSGSDDGTHFIVMELVEGRTLSERIREEGPMAPNEVVRIGGDVALALAAAHDRGVIHRDVKPGNVMLTQDGTVKVVDFGIAHASGAEAITRSGLVLGSAACLSPEQAQGASGDRRSDIYALGCVLYHMLTGRPPFVADDAVAALYQHVNEPPTPPSSFRPVPSELEQIVLRCLEKDPSRRFDSAHELEEAMSVSTRATTTMPLPPAALEVTEPIAHPDAAPSLAASAPPSSTRPMLPVQRPTRRWTWIAAAVAAALLLAGVVALLANPAGRRDPGSAAGPSRVQAPAGPQSVGEAYEALRTRIQEAEGSGAVDDGSAEDLLDSAAEAFTAWEVGDVEALQEAVSDLEGDLAAAVEDDEITDTAASTIGGSVDDFITAIRRDPPVATESSPSPAGDDEGHGDGDGDGDGDGGEHGGGPGPG
jgi:serine/threonine-protein kinase